MRFWKYKSKFVYTASGLAAASAAVFLGGVFFVGQPTPSFGEVRSLYKPSDAWVVDRNGEPLESIRIANGNRSLDWTALNEVSPAFKNFLISSEDHRFYSHHGIDVLALARASRRRGASTITMQLANLIYKSRHHQRAPSPYVRKAQQIFEAIRLDANWSKEQILEAYLNLLPFRGEVTGLRAASLGYFAKSPRSLDDLESAILVASIRSPNAPLEKVSSRACEIIARASSTPECDSLKSLVLKSLGSGYRVATDRSLVPVLSQDFVVTPKDSVSHRSIETTLDARVQRTAMSAIREQLRELHEKNVGDAAAVVMETSSGKILAYAANAGRGYASASQIDGVRMRRQAGSTLKPFVYGTAFDMGILRVNSLVEDSPEDLAVGGGGVYSPKNYEQEFQGFVSAGEALGSSLNVPAVRTVELVREARVLDKMAQLGFTHLESDDHYGPSLALGTVDVSLLELTNAYRQLSLFGSSKAFTDSTKLQLFSALSLPEYRRYTFGLNSILGLPFPAAVKTGTSKDMRDNWCIGYTSEFTVGVWVGNFNGQPMWNVSGISGAAPIWRHLMVSLHKSPTRDTPATFLPAAEPLARNTISRIKYPQSGMLIGYDPDIPKSKQKVPIRIEHPQSEQIIFVDGKKLSQSKDVSFWTLARGKHEVQLRTSKGDAIDQVQFVVR